MERLAAWVIGALTFIVIGGIALVIYVPRGGHAGGSSWLPEINASLNGTAAILLSTGYVLIRRRRIGAHRACMIAAFAASSLFLITYLIHHARVGSVPFHGAAWLRPVYFGLLIPHICAGGARGAAGADDHPPRLAGSLRPSPAAGAGDAAHLAVRLGQRRSRLPPPLPLRSLSPSHRLSPRWVRPASTTSTASRRPSARRTSRPGRLPGREARAGQDSSGPRTPWRDASLRAELDGRIGDRSSKRPL